MLQNLKFWLTTVVHNLFIAVCAIITRLAGELSNDLSPLAA